MENELLNLLRDLVGDFPSGVNSNALEAAREYLANAESGPTPVPADKCPSCSGEGITGSKETRFINCPACNGTGIRR